MGPASFDCRRSAVIVSFAVTALLASGGVHAAFAPAGGFRSNNDLVHGARHLQETEDATGPFDNTDVARSSRGLRSSDGNVNVNNVGGRKLMGFGRADLNARGYAPGTCHVDILHYQIPEGPNNFYSIEALINDANGDTIGNIGRTTATGPIDISSKLPYQLIVTTVLPGSVPNTDAEPVQFAYAGESWNSNNLGFCSQGDYEDGKRNILCGFAC